MPGRTSDRRGAVPSVGMLDCERLWNVRDVSTFLGIPVSTLHQWRYLGTEPPAFRVGSICYDPATVRRWLVEHCHRPERA